MKKRIISAVVSAVMLMSVTAQAYEVECLDKTRRSIGEAADAAGMSYEEYKKYLMLNDDIPEWETENAAELKTYVMPMINRYGLTVDEFKNDYNLTIDVNDTTTWCEVYDNMSLSAFWGIDYDAAKEYYGFGDEITPETLYGEVRAKVEEIDMNAVERASFSDVGYAHWAHYYISEMQKIAVIDGYDDGTYLPEKTVTRAEFAKIFASCANIVTEDYENQYSDVSTDLWYAPYVNAVSDYIDAENGIFNPEAPATREVVATAIAKYLGVSNEASADLLMEKFTDADTVSGKNAVYVADAVEKGIIDGFDDGTIRGGDSLTRAQAATVIYRAFYEYYELPAVYNTVVAKVGDIDITLGDALFTVSVDETADLNNPEVLTEQLTNAAQLTANYFRYTELAQKEGITFTENDMLSIWSYRAQYASGIGYRKFSNYLKSSGTSIEYLNKYVEKLMYSEKLLQKYDEAAITVMVENIETTVYEDVISGITLADFATN